MIPFIRHGEKLWANGRKPKQARGYSHDPPIDRKQAGAIHDLADELYQETKPCKIITSPFLRCRQTAEEIQTFLRRNYRHKIAIEVDTDLREYLGHWKEGTSGLPHQIEISKDISPGTLSYLTEVKVIETMIEFKERIGRLPMKEWAKKPVWVVTHGIVIFFLYKSFCPDSDLETLDWQPFHLS